MRKNSKIILLKTRISKTIKINKIRFIIQTYLNILTKIRTAQQKKKKYF